ncbi:SGNH/GDSL hydrolase family protein [Serratia sp. KG1D]|uniref:SGNH/GDSL hydrolase family protein n=1 Tax=Serratia sp. KG1D TaxID=3120277 RepID=UPI00301AAB8E
MKKIFCTLFLLSTAAFSKGDLSPLPDSGAKHNLSPNGPEIIGKGSPFLLGKAKSTYTYMRCYYRINPASTIPQADYLWARALNSTSYYRLEGHWWSSLAVSWKNMFYSDTPLSALQQVCGDTLSRAGIRQPLAMIAAANNKLSFNYTVWSNDSPVQSVTINKIIVFGDSLSDTNNVFNASLWRFPNPKSWFLGRFSNGPTWVEYLAKQSRLPIYNWAVGGAASKQTKWVIPGLLEQVDSWLIYMKEAKNYQPENSLFTVWIGANDLVTYNQGVDGLIENQGKALTRLASTGAKKILVLNLPDITRAPEFAHRKDGKEIKRQIDDYNLRIKQVADDINSRYPSQPVMLFDLAALFTDMLDNPGRYQVSEVKTSCLDIQAPSSLNYINAIPVRAACTDADRYVFWDLLHPTTHTHRLLAEHIFNYLKQQQVWR